MSVEYPHIIPLHHPVSPFPSLLGTHKNKQPLGVNYVFSEIIFITWSSAYRVKEKSRRGNFSQNLIPLSMYPY